MGISLELIIKIDWASAARCAEATIIYLSV